MAVKKETAQQAAEAATQDDKAGQGVQAEKPATEVIHLFKDRHLLCRVFLLRRETE